MLGAAAIVPTVAPGEAGARSDRRADASARSKLCANPIEKEGRAVPRALRGRRPARRAPASRRPLPRSAYDADDCLPRGDCPRDAAIPGSLSRAPEGLAVLLPPPSAGVCCGRPFLVEGQPPRIASVRSERSSAWVVGPGSLPMLGEGHGTCARRGHRLPRRTDGARRRRRSAGSLLRLRRAPEGRPIVVRSPAGLAAAQNGSRHAESASRFHLTRFTSAPRRDHAPARIDQRAPLPSRSDRRT